MLKDFLNLNTKKLELFYFTTCSAQNVDETYVCSYILKIYSTNKQVMCVGAVNIGTSIKFWYGNLWLENGTDVCLLNSISKIICVSVTSCSVVAASIIE